MKNYVLHYVFDDEKEELDLFWRCQADDYGHAKEQLEDYHKDEPGEILFIECIKETNDACT